MILAVLPVPPVRKIAKAAHKKIWQQTGTGIVRYTTFIKRSVVSLDDVPSETRTHPAAS